jgi:hypothetical protein
MAILKWDCINYPNPPFYKAMSAAANFRKSSSLAHDQKASPPRFIFGAWSVSQLSGAV